MHPVNALRPNRCPVPGVLFNRWMASSDRVQRIMIDRGICFRSRSVKRRGELINEKACELKESEDSQEERIDAIAGDSLGFGARARTAHPASPLRIEMKATRFAIHPSDQKESS